MAAVAPLYTADQYEVLISAGVIGPDDHVELLLGVIVEVSHQGPRHAAVVMLCAEAVNVAVGGRAALRSRLPLRVGPYSMPAPDLAVVSGRTSDYLGAHPSGALLVVEVAGSSIGQDRMTKAAVYAEAGVEEFWIVDLAEGSVLIHIEPDRAARRYRGERRAGRGERITLSALADASVLVDELFGPLTG